MTPKQIGLYRDDGLIFISEINGPKTSRIQKKILRAFRLLGFKIEIMSNLKVKNFLDITLNLSENCFKPSYKDKQTPSNINVNSNHSRLIIRQIPNAVNIRIYRLSSTKKIFHENNRMYDETVEKSGFKQRLEYLEIFQDNFETCNTENNNNNNSNNGTVND